MPVIFQELTFLASTLHYSHLRIKIKFLPHQWQNTFRDIRDNYIEAGYSPKGWLPTNLEYM